MQLTQLIAKTRTLGRTLSGMAELGVSSRETYDEVLRQTLRSTPDAYGTWTVWEPGALDGRDQKFRNKPGHDSSGRYVPFWFKDGTQIALEPNTNYERPGIGNYYLIPRQTGGERTVLLSPYLHLSGHKHFLTCHIVPLILRDRFVGVAGIDALPESVEGVRRPSENIRLSAREHEVLQWIAAGKTNAEIAVILGISPHTAKHHVANVIEKLGVENRRGAMRAYLSGDLAA